MDRKDKIFFYIDKNKPGIEIGPSHNPLAPKKEGYQVHIIDHMNREQLIAKYKDHNVDIQNIEEVDFVWNGESFCELTGKSKFYDWIIASHVIEHTPDLIGFLNSCEEVLKETGVLSLVIPDKRYCFDHFRPIAGLAKILDSHYQGNRIHSAGTVAEYFLNVVSKAGIIAWTPDTLGDYSLVHGLDDAKRGIDAVLNHQAYLDVHAWCFVPHSFRLIIHDLFCLGLTQLKEVDFFPTENHEFYMTLSRNGKGLEQNRLDVLSIIENEQSLSA